MAEKTRPRWVLHMQATFWRVLMGIGMLLHKMASPRPPKPNFNRSVHSTVAGKSGTFNVSFYTPEGYEKERRSAFKDVRDGKGYPVVINFHGGGFTLGTSSDDARWIGTVTDECHAVVASVDYRLAPESPFPTAVEDGVDAVLYIAERYKELGIDKEKIALSGFSSGGNMAFTVPLRLYDFLTDFSRPLSLNPREALARTVSSMANPHGTLQPGSAATSSTSILPKPANLTGQAEYSALSVPGQPPMARSASALKTATNSVTETPSVSICAIVPWYPSTDYTRTRQQRRATLTHKDHDLPAIFTELFDQSYLHPPDTIPLDSPYLSPGIATSGHLRNALPKDIIMHTCEWDMLLAEGEAFHQRLISPEIGKKVAYTMVEGVPHGWDKAPNPLKPTPGVKQYYLSACKELRRVFEDRASDVELDMRRRKSVPVVR